MKHKNILYKARELRKNPTEAEAFFWDKVRKRKFLGYKFNRQYVIPYSDELNVTKHYIVDFFCFEKKIIVEIDGEIHNKQKAYDKIRDEDLTNHGFKVIHFSNDEILQNWDYVEKRLKDIFEK